MNVRGDLEVRRDLLISRDELEESVSRAGGPGGQHVNKTSTRVTLRWNVPGSRSLTDRQRQRLLAELAPRLTRDGDLVVHADGYRSQARNRELARERVASIVRAALVERAPRRPTAPSKRARARRVDSKTRRGATKSKRGRIDPNSD
jgi:ribosome-associated protein